MVGAGVAGGAVGAAGGVAGDAGAVGSAGGVVVAGELVLAEAVLVAVAAVAGVAEAALVDADSFLAGEEAEPLIAAANAIRLVRAVVNFALVSSSSPTAAVAFDGAVPVVPAGFGSVVALALALAAGAPASSSPRILSAAAASLAHFEELPALASALLPATLSSALRCFFKSAIWDFALPVTALAAMLFTAASAFCRCSWGVPCALSLS